MEKQIEKHLKEKCDIVDVISYAMRDFDDYLDECHEEEIPPIDTCEDFIADGILSAGYRKQSEGEWIYHECVSSYDGTISGYSCSACSAFVNEEVFDSDEFHKDFCGHCGAKMKGGEG